MDYDRGLVAITVTFILAATLISGPLVPTIDFTTTDDALLSEGVEDQATVRIASEPEGPVVLERGSFGNDVYQLEVPEMRIDVAAVQGSPRVTYKIRIRGLGYSRVTSYFLDSGQQGEEFVLRIERDTIDRNRVTDSEYTGELSVTVYDSDGSTVVYRTNRTVVVRE